MKRHPIEVIEEVAAQEGTGSQKRKKELIRDWFDDPNDKRPVEDRELYKAIFYTYNPWFNYYVQTVPGLTQIHSDAKKRGKARRSGRRNIFDTGPKTFGWTKQFDTMFQLLDDLKDRKLPPNSSQAREAVCRWAEKCGAGTIEIFRRILRGDQKIGLKATSLNKIFPDWIPQFKLSLARPFDEKRITYPAFVDPKFDGERCLAFVTVDGNEGSVTYLSRNGNEFYNFDTFSEDLVRVFRSEGSVVADCEVINKRGFQTLMKVPKYYDRNFDPSGLQLVVFDWMPVDSFYANQYDVPQHARYHSLTKLFKQYNGDRLQAVATRVAKSFPEVEKIFEHWVSKGLEGVIIKQWDGEYHFSTSSSRNPGWTKLKPTKSEDLKIVGMKLGDSGREWAGKCGSLVVQRDDPDRGSVLIGVGSGLTDYMHENIVEIGDQILYTQPDGEVIDLKGKVVEVKFDNVTEDGSLRFPRLKPRGDILIRTDK